MARSWDSSVGSHISRLSGLLMVGHGAALLVIFNTRATNPSSASMELKDLAWWFDVGLVAAFFTAYLRFVGAFAPWRAILKPCPPAFAPHRSFWAIVRRRFPQALSRAYTPPMKSAVFAIALLAACSPAPQSKTETPAAPAAPTGAAPNAAGFSATPAEGQWFFNGDEGVISAISSKKIVPPCASSNRPMRVAVAPVNAPRSCPNNSLSSSVSGMAAQLTLMIFPVARALHP